MKRIEFIAPVEAVRGNLSGRQDLRYALNNNKAFESPAGAINYARNYTPRYVGAKIAKSGAKIFSVRTKNAVNMTAKAVKAMALMGGTGALVGSLLAHKSGTPYQQMYALWQYALEHDASYAGYSFRKFASEVIRPKLEAKAQLISANIASISFSIKNPWYDGTQTTDANVSQKVLVEFWKQLAPNAITFAVDGKKGIAQSGESFSDVIDSTAKNVLNLQSADIAGTEYVTMGGAYLLKGATYVHNIDNVVANESYTTTEVAPA